MIRLAKHEDAPRIHQLLEQIATLHRDLYPDRFKKGSKYTVEQVEELIESSKVLMFVYEATRVEGYIIVKVEESVLFVDDLCVDAPARGKKVGKQLVDAVYAYGQQHGYKEIQLNVWDKNTSARRFYDSLDFEPLKTTLSKHID